MSVRSSRAVSCDEDVLGVRVRARDNRTGALDPGLDQHGVVGGVALDETYADRLGELPVL